MKKLLFIFAVLVLAPSFALALPGSSVYPKPTHKVWETDNGNKYGPVPCKACHTSNKAFESNVYVDVRDEDGNSLMNSKGEAEIAYQPGGSSKVSVVVGLKKPDRKAKLAGWFVNLPMGASLAGGSVNYCYQRLNYEVEGQFTADGKPYRTQDIHSITFHRYMTPQTTELWVGIGGKATETKPGSPERKGTLGLKAVPIKWIKANL